MNLVEVLAFSREKIKIAFFTIFTEFYIHSLRVIVSIAQKELSFLVETVVVGHPGQSQHSFLQGFAQRNPADGVGVGSRQGLYLVFLQVAMLIVKRLCGSRHSSSCDIVVVLELPVGPTPEMKLHKISQDLDFLSTLDAVGESSKFRHETSSLQVNDVLFLRSHLQSIKDLTKLFRFGFSKRGNIRAVDMIAKNLSFKLTLSPRRIDKTTSKDIENTRLKENWSFFVYLSDRLKYSSVCRQQIFIV